MDTFKRYNMNLIYSDGRWFSKRILLKNNFFLPLFYTETEIFFALSCGENKKWSVEYKEFVYKILLRYESKLFEISIVRDSISNSNIDFPH